MKLPATLTLLAILAFLSSPPAFADDAPAKSPEEIQRDAALQKLTDDIQSNDAGRLSSAIAQIRASYLHGGPGFDNRALEALSAAKKFTDLDSICSDAIPKHTDDPWETSILLKTRVHALIAQGKFPEALSAAKSFYNVAPLEQTRDAISTVALCLTLAHPDDHTIAHRFNRQQLDASSAPAQPAADPATQPAESSILASIKIDPKPYEQAISDMTLDDYLSFIKKGNLLLVAGQTKEARQVFEQASDLADADQAASAIENQARAIRADTGSIGAANAYVLSMRDKK